MADAVTWLRDAVRKVADAIPPDPTKNEPLGNESIVGLVLNSASFRDVVGKELARARRDVLKIRMVQYSNAAHDMQVTYDRLSTEAAALEVEVGA